MDLSLYVVLKNYESKKLSKRFHVLILLDVLIVGFIRNTFVPIYIVQIKILLWYQNFVYYYVFERIFKIEEIYLVSEYLEMVIEMNYWHDKRKEKLQKRRGNFFNLLYQTV